MPSVTIWNRVEPRCRTQDLSSGLAARVHDPLWLLTRQWQVGEFAGRDAGSPITAQVQWTTAAFDRYASGVEPAQPYAGGQPIETLVEREAVRPPRGGTDLRQAAEAGLHFLRLLGAAGLSRLWGVYLAQYPLAAPTGADTNALKTASIIANRVVDGVRLRADLAATSGKLPATPALSAADGALILPVLTAWTAWFDALFSEPTSPSSWSPERMEYSFALGAAGDANGLVAREYDGGSVDWHTFDRGSQPLAGGTAAPVKGTRNINVAPVTFRGMPARRFWEMEDAAVDIAALSAGAEDLGRLLLREFALIFGNDWFQVPLATPVGCQVSIDSLKVADTFGVVSTIPHYAAADGAAGAWRMYSLGADTSPATPASANLLVVAPSSVGTMDSAAIEDVLLLRDEAAEMAWGVERTALGPSGDPIDRSLLWRANQPPAAPPSTSSVPKYRLGSTAPDYWVPFLPVAVNDGPLQMRRGRLPTAASGPIGQLLGYPGLTIFLEELPKEGIHLERLYRYARGVDGSTHLWIGRRRLVGRGEGRSGLRFDFLEF